MVCRGDGPPVAARVPKSNLHRDLEVKLKELVGSKSKGVLHNMQKTVLSGTLNIARTYKVAT